MSQFEDCRKLCNDRKKVEELEEECIPVRIPIVVTGTSLAIVIQCDECSDKYDLCAKKKKCK